MPASRQSIALWLGALMVLALVHSLFLWQAQPTWPDSTAFTGLLNNGKWVGHPPGYLLFFTLGRLLMSLGFQAVDAQQTLSAGAYLLSLPLLFTLLQRFGESGRALLLTAAFAFSWIPFNIATSGTTHSSDLLFSSLFLLIATSPGFRSGKPLFFALLFISMLLCGANRFSTILMLSPLWLLLALEHFRRPAWWLCAFLYAGAQACVFLLVAHLSGGWDLYQQKVAVLQEGNRTASPLLTGFNPATLLNVFRTFFWFFLATGPMALLLLAWILRHSSRFKDCLQVPYEIKVASAILAGCLGVCSLYLCVHIGYLAPALPAFYLLLACVMSAKPTFQNMFIPAVISSVVLAVGMFYLMQPLPHPRNLKEAAANALLLQYSKRGLENPGWKSLSRWLLNAGLKDEVPENRQDASQ